MFSSEQQDMTVQLSVRERKKEVTTYSKKKFQLRKNTTNPATLLEASQSRPESRWERRPGAHSRARGPLPRAKQCRSPKIPYPIVSYSAITKESPTYGPYPNAQSCKPQKILNSRILGDSSCLPLGGSASPVEKPRAWSGLSANISNEHICIYTCV